MTFATALVQQRVQHSCGGRQRAGRSSRLTIVARGSGRFFIGG